jgi:hypothetical protein
MWNTSKAKIPTKFRKIFGNLSIGIVVPDFRNQEMSTGHMISKRADVLFNRSAKALAERSGSTSTFIPTFNFVICAIHLGHLLSFVYVFR